MLIIGGLINFNILTLQERSINFKIFAMRLLFVILLCFSALTSQAREVINLNNGWRFYKNASFTDKTNEVNLPHTWNSEINRDKGDLYFGTGTYLKEIIVPNEWLQKRIYLRFKGVSLNATLFVNGKYVGTHKGAFSSFNFEITSFVNYGTYNSILLVANNSIDMDVMPVGVEMTMYGGIYRDVEMVLTDNNHIGFSDYDSDGVYLTQVSVSNDMANVDAKVMIDGRVGTKVGVRVEVKDGDQYITDAEAMTTIEINGKAEVTVPLTVVNPRLWNGVYDPFMYDVKVTLTDEAGNSDEVETNLGLRWFEVDRDRGFMLNGEPYKLKGVLLYQDRSGVGSAMLKSHHEEDIAIITEMGATAIRMANAPQDRYLYELCDKNGIIVWSDLPLVSDDIHSGKGFIDSYNFRANGEDQLREMIRQNYNSPSIAFWGLFSKLTTKGDDCRPYIEVLNKIAREESHDRFTVGTSNEDGGINMITDVISWAQYYGWKSGNPSDLEQWLDQFKKNWIELKPGIGEYGAGANIFHQTESLIQPKDLDNNLHPEKWQSYVHEQHIPILKERDYVWGSFINSMFDYANPNMSSGNMTGISDMGLVTWDRHVKKDAFYLYKANWNTLDPFVYITEKRNYQRSNTTQNIKVYSNLDEVELFVNGVSVGSQRATNGIITWENILLNRGKNKISAISGRTKDESTIEIINIL